MDEIEGFDWDAANVGHILRHSEAEKKLRISRKVAKAQRPPRRIPLLASRTLRLCAFARDALCFRQFFLSFSVTPFEVEEVTRRPHVTIPAKAVQGEERWKLFGKTAFDRYLVVVFTIRQTLFRTVTAYEMNIAERREYAPHIG